MNWLRSWWSRIPASKPIRQCAQPRTEKRFCPTFEYLEDRITPAQVNATLAAGLLTLKTAAPLAVTTEDLAFAPTGSSIPGEFTVTAAPGTTISLNGAAAVAAITLSGVSSINISLGAGNDHIFESVGNSIRLTGGMTIDMGTQAVGGADTVDLGSVMLGGNLSVTYGAMAAPGDATSTSVMQFRTALIGGNVSVNFGSGLKDTQFNARAIA